MIGNKPRQATSDKRQGGFTLIEMLVATGIFVLVITLVSTIFVSTIGNQRRAFGLQDVLDSSRFALEAVARSIRQSDITSASQTSLTLAHPTKGAVTYSLSAGRLYEGNQPVTSQDVTVEDLRFLVSGLGAGDGLQPRVTIILRVRSNATKASEQKFVSIQTTVTPRNLELP